ncbi:MAG: hypothetical protein RIF33_13450 [Cyclobacteriaceae bacterium]
MKISNIILAIGLLFFAACGGKATEEHGHEHGPDADHSHDADGHSHEAGDNTEQEEFTMSADSTKARSTVVH